MDTTPMSEQSGTQGVPGSTGPNPVDQFRAWAQAQTQLSPNMQHTQQQPQPQQQQGQRQAGQGRAVSLQNLGSTLQNVIGKVGEKLQQRKATEQQHLFDRYAQTTAGITAAKAQFQEAITALKANPQDPVARQKLQEAQQASAQNQAIQDAMFNGPNGEKNYKTLAKGFGIDDKNANTPEREAAKKAYMKTMGVGERSASIGSQLPMTRQPVPGQQQQKPATQGQELNAAVQMRGQDLDALAQTRFWLRHGQKIAVVRGQQACDIDARSERRCGS